MKSVLISIQPHWCELIASGKKTIELRKTKPKIDTPFKCYIYCTKAKPFLFNFNSVLSTSMHKDDVDIYNKDNLLNGKVIGEFVCDKIYEIDQPYLTWLEHASCVDMNIIAEYKGVREYIYGWHISDLVIYDTPRGLSEYKTTYCDIDCKACVLPNCANGLSRPPRSWCYVEGKDGEQE